MQQNNTCPICKREANIEGSGPLNTEFRIVCETCGEYTLSDRLYPNINISRKRKDQLYKVSSWIYEQNNTFGEIPTITTDKFEKLLDMRDKKIKEKFECIMKQLLENKSKDELKTACWIKDDSELYYLLKKANESNYIDGAFLDIASSGEYLIDTSGTHLTFDGLEYVESLEEANLGSKQVFAAFYFSENIKSIFDEKVKEAVEECEMEYTRVSSSTTKHDTTINDEIISKIKSSRLVIADFTGQRNSVYFEAGYAMGIGIPVIWTCKKSDVEKLSFDTRQYPHILWENGDDLKKQLINRIRAVL